MRRRLKLILLAAGIVALALVVSVFTLPPERAGGSSVRSTYNTGVLGCKAFYELLSQLDRRPAARLGHPSDLGKFRGLLIVVGPLKAPLSDEHARQIMNWVYEGNSLLYFVGVEERGRAPSMLDAQFVSRRELAGSWAWMELAERPAKLEGDHPAFRPAREVSCTATWRDRVTLRLQGTVLYSDYRWPAAIWRPWGRGQVVVCASSAPVQNGLISKDNNLEFLLCALRVLRPMGGRVIFDELHQGYGRPVTLAGMLSLEGMLAAAVQLAVCGMLYVWLEGRRMGPTLRPPRRRRTPQEYLQAAGLLYRQCCRPGELAAAYRAYALRVLSRRLGLEPQASAEQWAAALAQRTGRSQAEMHALLTRAALAGTTRLRPRQAVEIVQALDELLTSV